MIALLLTLAPSPPQGYDAFLAERRTPVVRVVDQARPAVVCVEAVRTVFRGWTFGGRPDREEQTTTGSGVVVYQDGYIVTNHHVVARAEKINVRFDPEVDSQVYRARLVSSVPDEDLALLKVETQEPLSVVRFGTSSDLMLGEPVIAIGNSYGQGLTVSRGIISGLHRDLQAGAHPFQDLIQTDASINPGNSGGPLLNVLGELVGINTVFKMDAENMGYAIPVDTIQEVLQSQLLGDQAARAWLGFEFEEGLPVRVTRVVVGGPAHEAGLREGDQIAAIDGHPVSGMEEFLRHRLPLLPNQLVALRCLRAEDEVDVHLRGWTKVDGVLLDRLGMTVEPLGIGRAKLVRVERVSEGGPAAQLGLQPGDVIDAVRLVGHNQAWRIQRPADLAQLVHQVEPGSSLALDILRDDNADGRLEREELYKGTLSIH